MLLLSSPGHRPRSSAPFPYTTLFRSRGRLLERALVFAQRLEGVQVRGHHRRVEITDPPVGAGRLLEHPQVAEGDRKSTRLNSSHLVISYAVFCLKKKNKDKSTKLFVQ